MNCGPCGKMFSGPVSYQQHMQSEKHKRKLDTLSFFNGGDTENPRPDSKPVSAYNPMNCPVCNIDFDSFVLFQSHSLTLEHVNNVSKVCVNDASGSLNLGTVSSTTLSDKILEDNFSKNQDETDTILPPTHNFEAPQFASFAECKTCNKQFSGPEPYKQHLVSAMHKKKLEMEIFLSGQANHNQSENVFNRFVCDPCKKVFSGHVPYQQHIVSDLHRKKLQNIQLMEELAGNKGIKPVECDSYMDNQNPKPNVDILKNMDMNRPWFCNICMIQCSGLVPFNQHLQGDTHFKNLRRAGSMQFNIESESKSGNFSVDMTPTTVNEELTVPSTVFAGNKTAYNMESDTILPQALQNLSVLSPSDFKLKEFLPDEKINFDNFENDTITDKKDLKMDLNFKNEQSKDIYENSSIQQDVLIQEDKETSEVYEECKLCNVKLISKNAALSHFESIEHFQKKWQSS